MKRLRGLDPADGPRVTAEVEARRSAERAKRAEEHRRDVERWARYLGSDKAYATTDRDQATREIDARLAAEVPDDAEWVRPIAIEAWETTVRGRTVHPDWLARARKTVAAAGIAS